MPSKLSTHGLGRGPSQSLIDAGAVGGLWVNANPPAISAPFLTLWRWVEQGDPAHDWRPNMSGPDAARRWVDVQWPHLQHVPPGAVILGPNEPSVWDEGAGAWYAAFEIERMRLMEERGYRACIGNWSTGRPPLPHENGTWDAFLPALCYAGERGHLLGLHEYGYEIDGWNLGRCLKVYEWLRWQNVPLPGLVITEWGLDGALGPFRDARWRAGKPDPDRAYLDLMRAYDAEARKFSWFHSFYVFTEGHNNDPAWQPFDIAGQPVVGMMAQYIAEQRSVVDDSGDGNMSKFKPGDRVQTTRNCPVLNVSRETLYDLPGGALATVINGPHTLSGSDKTYYLITPDDGRQTGYADETRLQLHAVNPPGDQDNRNIELRLAHHDGAGHHIYRAPSLDTGYLKRGDGHDAVLEWLGGGFVKAVSYSWNDRVRTWVFKIERNAVNGAALWAATEPPHGYVEYVKNGGTPTLLNRLEVAVRDGKPVPNFDLPPSAQPEPPPVEPPPPPVPPPAVDPAGNLLANWSFEDTPFLSPPGDVSGVLPPGWTLKGYARPGMPRLNKQDAEWAQPEIVVKTHPDNLPEAHLVRHGRRCLKVFKGWAPTSAAFAQTLTLPPGRYRLTVPVFPDHYDNNDRRPGPPSPDFYEGTILRVWFAAANRLVDGRQTPFGAWTNVDVEAQHGGGTAEIGFELVGKWGFKNNGWFVDAVTLVRLDGEPEPPPPPPDDEPPPPVGELPDISAELDAIEAAAGAALAGVNAIREKMRG